MIAPVINSDPILAIALCFVLVIGAALTTLLTHAGVELGCRGRWAGALIAALLGAASFGLTLGAGALLILMVSGSIQ